MDEDFHYQGMDMSIFSPRHEKKVQGARQATGIFDSFFIANVFTFLSNDTLSIIFAKLLQTVFFNLFYAIEVLKTVLQGWNAVISEKAKVSNWVWFIAPVLKLGLITMGIFGSAILGQLTPYIFVLASAIAFVSDTVKCLYHFVNFIRFKYLNKDAVLKAHHGEMAKQYGIASIIGLVATTAMYFLFVKGPALISTVFGFIGAGTFLLSGSYYFVKFRQWLSNLDKPKTPKTTDDTTHEKTAGETNELLPQQQAKPTLLQRMLGRGKNYSAVKTVTMNADPAAKPEKKAYPTLCPKQRAILSCRIQRKQREKSFGKAQAFKQYRAIYLEDNFLLKGKMVEAKKWLTNEINEKLASFDTNTKCKGSLFGSARAYFLDKTNNDKKDFLKELKKNLECQYEDPFELKSKTLAPLPAYEKYIEKLKEKYPKAFTTYHKAFSDCEDLLEAFVVLQQYLIKPNEQTEHPSP